MFHSPCDTAPWGGLACHSLSGHTSVTEETLKTNSRRDKTSNALLKFEKAILAASFFLLELINAFEWTPALMMPQWTLSCPFQQKLQFDNFLDIDWKSREVLSSTKYSGNTNVAAC